MDTVVLQTTIFVLNFTLDNRDKLQTYYIDSHKSLCRTNRATDLRERGHG